MVEDFIRIYGDENDPAPFQGIGGVAVGDTSGGAIAGDVNVTLASDDIDISLALWQAQTTAIQKESDYLSQLDSLFKSQKTVLDTKGSQMAAFLTEALEEVVGTFVGKWVFGALGAASGASEIAAVVGFLAEFGVNLLFDKLGNLLTSGSKMIAAMQAENDVLSAIPDEERSHVVYSHREAIMQRHLQQIDVVLREIEIATKDVNQATKIDKISITGFEQFSQAFNTAFLHPDESLLEKGLEFLFDIDLNEESKGYVQDIRDRLGDLKYNDEVLYLPGGIRIHMKNKIIRVN